MFNAEYIETEFLFASVLFFVSVYYVMYKVHVD